MRARARAHTSHPHVSAADTTVKKFATTRATSAEIRSRIITETGAWDRGRSAPCNFVVARVSNKYIARTSLLGKLLARLHRGKRGVQRENGASQVSQLAGYVVPRAGAVRRYRAVIICFQSASRRNCPL